MFTYATFNLAGASFYHRIPADFVMAFPDEEFLSEVEDFLCGLPTFALPALERAGGVDEAVPATQESVGAAPCHSPRGRKKEEADAAAKMELAKAKDRKRRATYRERRRIIKETLKQQIGEMSEVVNKLQEARASVPSTAWQMMAKHQLQARLNAEAEQTQLSAAIAFRHEIIQELTKFVHTRLANAAWNPVALDEAMSTPKRIRVEPSDGDLVEVNLSKLDAVYAQTDKMLSTYGLDASESSQSDSRQQWQTDGKTGHFVYTDKLVVPTVFGQACEHMWGIVQLHHRQEDRQQYDVEDPQNTVAFKFRITRCLKSGKKVSVLQRAVARRYVQEDRMVVVWRTFTEGEAIFTGMHADECGWCVSTPASHTAEPGTLLRTVMRHVPMHFSAPSAAESMAEQFTGLLLNAGSEDATEIGNRLDKLLLEDKQGEPPRHLN
jgi:hypothetical protein